MVATSDVDEAKLHPALVLLGLTQLALGAFQALAPGAFFDAFADFGVRNDHYIRDISTLYLMLGIGLLLAARLPSWRVPVLFLATLQYVIHAINHVVDVDDAEPGWIGPADLVAVAAFAVLFAYLLRLAVRQRA